MVGCHGLAVLDGVDVDRHDAKALASRLYAEERAGRGAAGFAAHNDAVAIDQRVLDLPAQVGDQFAEACDLCNERVAALELVLARIRLPVERERLIGLAIETCERYYPAFQFAAWGGKTAEEAIEASLLDTVGSA